MEHRRSSIPIRGASVPQPSGAVISVVTRHAEEYKILFRAIAGILVNMSNLALLDAGVTVETVANAAASLRASKHTSLNVFMDSFRTHFFEHPNAGITWRGSSPP